MHADLDQLRWPFSLSGTHSGQSGRERRAHLARLTRPAPLALVVGAAAAATRKPVGLAPGERTAAPPARHPQSLRQTPAADRRRSRAAGPPRQPAACSGGGAGRRAPRDRAALASRGVPARPAAQVDAAHDNGPYPGRDRHPDPAVLAKENQLWGADRIRGEPLKLPGRVSKRTRQKYLRTARAPPPPGQTWATFLRNHTVEAFFVIALGSRRVVHPGVTRHSTDARVARQSREATPSGAAPGFPIRDNGRKYGSRFDRVAAGSGIRVLRTPIRTPRANAARERIPGSARRECLDHPRVLGERHPARVLREFVASFSRARPHQGISRAVPESTGAELGSRAGSIRAVAVLGDLHIPTSPARRVRPTDAFLATTADRRAGWAGRAVGGEPAGGPGRASGRSAGCADSPPRWACESAQPPPPGPSGPLSR